MEIKPNPRFAVSNESIMTTNDVAGIRVMRVGSSIKGMEKEDQSVASCESRRRR